MEVVHSQPMNLSSMHGTVDSYHSIDLASQRIVHHKCLQPCTFDCCASMCKQTCRRSVAEARRYSDNFSGMTWNPRAFFARDGIKMSRRIALARNMSSKLDFFGLQETHSTPERAAALQSEFSRHVLFWSHCSLQRGGLAPGISTEFLKNLCLLRRERLSRAEWVNLSLEVLQVH